MRNKSIQPGEPEASQEWVVLLRTLRIEATPEACFEERFLQDFRRRVEREVVCRPVHSLVWEHVSALMEHLGVRRVAFGASVFGLGALCMGFLTWQNAPSTAARTEHLCELESRANSLQPGVSRQVVSTTVLSERARRTPKRNIVVLAGDEEDPLYAGNMREDTALHELNTDPWSSAEGASFSPF